MCARCHQPPVPQDVEVDTRLATAGSPPTPDPAAPTADRPSRPAYTPRPSPPRPAAPAPRPHRASPGNRPAARAVPVAGEELRHSRACPSVHRVAPQQPSRQAHHPRITACITNRPRIAFDPEDTCRPRSTITTIPARHRPDTTRNVVTGSGLRTPPPMVRSLSVVSSGAAPESRPDLRRSLAPCRCVPAEERVTRFSR